MKKMLAIVLAVLGVYASAAEINGVKLDDTAKVGGQDLLLDGAGVRYKFGFIKIYVGALYCAQHSNNGDAIMAENRPRRITLTMLYHVSADKLHESLIEGLEANTSEAEFASLQARIKEMNGIFQAVKEVNVGDVVALDFLPGKGTQISVRGQVKDVIAGDDFSRAMMKVWLGKKPVSADLKAAMLGAK